MSALYFSQTREIAARPLDGEMMIMSLRDSTLFNLNEVGTLLWQAADGVTPLDEIVTNKVCPQFEVGQAEALADAEAFVRELAEHGILELSEQPIPSTAAVSKEHA